MGNGARSPYVVAFLSLVAPCVGHVYAGRVVQGLALAGATVAVGMLGTVVALATPSWTGVALAVAGAGWLGLWIAASISAIRGAREPDSAQTPREYDRWYVYALLVVLTYSSVTTWVVAIREKVVEVFHVPSTSMEPSIHSGARVLVDKLTYRRGPVQRGDIVVFVNPNERYQHYVKRVIALPGDTVETRGDDVFINGAKLAHGADLPDGEGVEETNGAARYRIRTAPDKGGTPAPAFGAMKVPNGHCFLLGDNRNHSVDSRDIGPVPLADVVGRVDRAL